MKLANLGKILGIAVLLIATAAIAADLGIKVTTQKASWRYKMTVEVETPEGIKTGSAVREVTVIKPEPEIQGLYDTRAFVKGEAVSINLGKRGLLFSLLDTDESYRIVFSVFPGPPGLSKKGIDYYSNLKNGKALLAPEKYSEFSRWATFKDLIDPKSVEAVDPNNLEGRFGEGVNIKKIIIEMTDEPVTIGIEKLLPWIRQYYDQRFDGDKSSAFDVNNTFANKMGSGYFSTEAQ